MAKKEGFRPNQEPMAIIVMDNGTWGSLRGACITIVTPKQYTQLCDGKIEPKDLLNVFDISFGTYFHHSCEED